jgi:hypothetical protein
MMKAKIKVVNIAAPLVVNSLEYDELRRSRV